MTLAVTPPAGSTPAEPLDPAAPPGEPLRRGARRLRAVTGRTWAVAATLVVVLIGGLVWWSAADHGPPVLTSADVAKQVDAALKAQQRAAAEKAPDAVTAYGILAPSLVTIVSTGGTSSERLGSGVVVDADGSILTRCTWSTAPSRSRSPSPTAPRAPPRSTDATAAERHRGAQPPTSCPPVVVPAAGGRAPASAMRSTPSATRSGLRGSLHRRRRLGPRPDASGRRRRARSTG